MQKAGTELHSIQGPRSDVSLFEMPCEIRLQKLRCRRQAARRSVVENFAKLRQIRGGGLLEITQLSTACISSHCNCLYFALFLR